MNYNEILYKTPVIETAHLILRRHREEDATEMLALWQDEEFKQYLIFPGIYTMEEAMDSIYNHFMPNPGFYVITEKGEDTYLGDIGLMIAKEHQRATFAYALNKKYWGKGYMTEALEACMTLCFKQLQLNRVQAQHFVGNTGSGKVMEKCGMRYEGTAYGQLFIRGSFVDVCHYGITKEEWRINKEKASV